MRFLIHLPVFQSGVRLFSFSFFFLWNEYDPTMLRIFFYVGMGYDTSIGLSSSDGAGSKYGATSNIYIFLSSQWENFKF